jgi:cystathionine gamma-lyase
MWEIEAIGAVPSPFECYLLNRGMKTLPVRMRQHMENGLAVARFLENHPSVERVLHPG